MIADMPMRLWAALGDAGFSYDEIRFIVEAVIRIPKRARPPETIGKKGSERAAAMVSAFKSGSTLQQIGDDWGITRERVRQILKKNGITGEDGGFKLVMDIARTEANEELMEKTETRSLAFYGCTPQELLELNEGKSVSEVGCLAMAYRSQMRNAENRDIAWEFTFPTWIAAWKESGRMHERGRGAEKYCMARIGDAGAYTPGNVLFTTNRNNGKEASEHAKNFYARDGRTRERDEYGLTQREREALDAYRGGATSPRSMADVMKVGYGTAYQYFRKAKRIAEAHA